MPRSRMLLGAIHIPEFTRFVETRDPTTTVLDVPLEALYQHWRAFLAEPNKDPKNQAARKSKSLIRCLLNIRGRGERLDPRRLARAREAVRRKPRDARTDVTDVTATIRTLLLWAGYPPERPRRVALKSIVRWMHENAIDTLEPIALSEYLRTRAPDGSGLHQWALQVIGDGGDRSLGAIQRLLMRARMHPDVDVDGTFARHRRTVPAAILMTFPDLCQYPAWFGRYVSMHVVESDRIHVLQFTQAVADGRMLHSGGGRCADRTRRSVAAGVRKIVTALRGMSAGVPGDPQSVMHLMPRTMQPLELTNLVARIVAHTLSQDRCTGPRRTDAPVDGVFRSFIHFFRGAIRNGVFEPSVSCTWRLAALPVQRIMLALEHEDSTRWRAFPSPNQTHTPRTIPTAHDVIALRGAAQDNPIEQHWAKFQLWELMSPNMKISNEKEETKEPVNFMKISSFL
jgi:hypothetical protein